MRRHPLPVSGTGYTSPAGPSAQDVGSVFRLLLSSEKCRSSICFDARGSGTQCQPFAEVLKFLIGQCQEERFQQYFCLAERGGDVIMAIVQSAPVLPRADRRPLDHVG